MQKIMYRTIEKYMQKCMNDVAHDCQHVYRVLYFALLIAQDYSVDKDVLIAACLLHDIGREGEAENPGLSHAEMGAAMAYGFLLDCNWPADKASHVNDCIITHSYRKNQEPASMEAKILFDADKLDAVGTMGIARTLAYQAIVGDPLYFVDEKGNVLGGDVDETPSFFYEYHWKLKNIYDKFYTRHAAELAREREKASIDFYQSMFREVEFIHRHGCALLAENID